MIPRLQLREIDLFRDFSEAHLDQLGMAATPSTLKRGEPVYRDGESGRVHAVVSGVVEIGRIGKHGRFVRLARLEKGEVFGALDGRAGGGSAVAAVVPETHLLAWESRALHEIMSQDAEFCLAFHRALVARLSDRLQSASDAVFTLLQAMAR
jgi:CRP-like cAMP-binding protein